MSGLTGAFRGLGKGMSREADRNLKKWDKEELLAEQEKLIIAREKRVDAAARLRQTDQNIYTEKNSQLAREQEVADNVTAQEDRIKLQKIKNSGLIEVQKAKNNSGGGAGHKLKDRVEWISMDKYDRNGFVIGTDLKGWDIVNQRWLTKDEENHGILQVAKRNAIAAALVKSKEEAANNAGDGKNVTPPPSESPNKVLAAIDASPKTGTEPVIPPTNKPGKKLSGAEFQKLTSEEKKAYLGKYKTFLEKRNAENRSLINSVLTLQEDNLTGGRYRPGIK
jgi:hypothetical protein